MNIIKPKKLQIGDTIGLLSVCGAISDVAALENSKKYFESMGYKVVVSSSSYNVDRYFAGTDKERADDFNSFFADTNIDAILCTRGGYGAIRILDNIDYDQVKNNPKIFAGYSDVTAFLTMIYKKTGLITFHSPMAMSDFAKKEVDEYTQNSFLKTLKGEATSVNAGINKMTFVNGLAKGILFGGNLSTLASLAGRDFLPEEKIILFLEDLNEPVYKIDKMFHQLLAVKHFANNIAGIVLGDFLSIDSPEYLEDLFFEISNKLNVPCCGGFNISHGAKKDTIPVGIKCEFNSTDGNIKFIETVVS